MRGWVRRVAVRAAALLGAGVFSCLPSSELASFSNGARSSAGDGVSPDGVSEEIVTESAPADPNATGEPPAEVTLDSACGGECPLPTLLGSEAENGAPTASENGASQGDAGLNEGDAGAPTQAVADAAAASCVAGAVLAGNQRCYLLVSAESSWPDARTRCQGQGTGWDLATVRSAGEEVFLAALALLAAIPDAWVGASDLQAEGAWRWVDDSAAFWNGSGSTGSRVGNAYVNWSDDGSAPEPNGGATADCLRLTAGGWVDSFCTTAQASICEGPMR